MVRLNLVTNEAPARCVHIHIVASSGRLLKFRLWQFHLKIILASPSPRHFSRSRSQQRKNAPQEKRQLRCTDCLNRPEDRYYCAFTCFVRAFLFSLSSLDNRAYTHPLISACSLSLALSLSPFISPLPLPSLPSTITHFCC
jgi:hypothetical protein